jgi:hypothetical protein
LARLTYLARYSLNASPALAKAAPGRQLAYMAANGVSGAFSVTNNLQVEGDNEAR